MTTWIIATALHCRSATGTSMATAKEVKMSISSMSPQRLDLRPLKTMKMSETILTRHARTSPKAMKIS